MPKSISLALRMPKGVATLGKTILGREVHASGITPGLKISRHALRIILAICTDGASAGLTTYPTARSPRA